jgi:hypothetical protein
MKTNTKWGLVVGLAGSLASATLLVAFHFWPGPHLLQALRWLNFPNFDFCDRFVASLFNPPPLAPPPKQAAIFALCLVVTAGIQWFVVGFLVRLAARKLRGTSNHPLKA